MFRFLQSSCSHSSSSLSQVFNFALHVVVIDFTSNNSIYSSYPTENPPLLPPFITLHSDFARFQPTCRSFHVVSVVLGILSADAGVLIVVIFVVVIQRSFTLLSRLAWFVRMEFCIRRRDGQSMHARIHVVELLTLWGCLWPEYG